MPDRDMTYCEIEATLGISSISIYKILHGHLAVEKIFSRWIPHNLTRPCVFYFVILKRLCWQIEADM